MKRVKKVRKPRTLIARVAAGIESIEVNGERADVYLTGVNLYSGIQQLHLTKQDVKHLAIWLTRVDAYFDQQEEKRK